VSGSGRFITIEGGEGTGKSSLVAGLAQALRAQGRDLVVTREPGGTPAADRIRALFGAPPDGDPLLIETEALLVSAARAQHVGRLLRPALERGAWVLCDRYHDSMRVYQGVLGGVNAAFLEQLIAGSTKGLDPDLTILLDCDVAVAKARLTQRREGEDERDAVKRFDDAKAATHDKVRRGFLELAERYPRRFVTLNAAQTPEALLAEAIGVVEKRLGRS
jgi:dTMP kinase